MGVREALLVATSSYHDAQLRTLSAPAQDVRALAQVLSAPDIGGYKVHTVCDQPAHVVRRRVQEFLVRRRTDDQLLVYFSCHGIKDDDGRLYFAGTDTDHDPDFLESSAVPAAFVSAELQRCVARSIVVLLDCCYSGAFDPGAKSDKSVHLRERFDGTGIAVITATNALQFAWEGDRFTNLAQDGLSTFTAAIVDGLRTGHADLDADGRVSVEDLYLYVRDRILASGAKQTPQRWLLGSEGRLTVALVPYTRPDRSNSASAPRPTATRAHPALIVPPAPAESSSGQRPRFTAPQLGRRHWVPAVPVRRAAMVLAGLAMAVTAGVWWEFYRPDSTGNHTRGGSSPSASSPTASHSSKPPQGDPVFNTGSIPVNTAPIMQLSPCPGADTELRLRSVQNAYAPSDKDVRLDLTLSAPSVTSACRTDVGREAVVVTITQASTDDDIWSGEDCPGKYSRHRWVKIGPDAPVTFTYHWDKSASAPDCASTSPAKAGPGTYLAEATAKGTVKAQTSFVLDKD